MRKKQIYFFVAVLLLVMFVLWTFAVRFIDVKPIGPDNSLVGFATLNGLFHSLTGVNFTLYSITDWAGLVPFFIAFGFGIFGLVQWIKRKSILKVDKSILTLGGFYAAVICLYILFEKCIINYRPVLIDGYLEASYPSSTTLLSLCVMPTAAMQFNFRIKSTAFRRCINTAVILFTAFTVLGRLASGVHWLTDIIGGIILSIGLVLMYYSANKDI